MDILNSSKHIVDYCEKLGVSSLFAEEGFVLPVESSVKLNASDAPSWLMASAAAGNNVAGFFHKLPSMENVRSVRGLCLFFSTELPDSVRIPTFFCRSAVDLTELIPWAIRTSIDADTPVLAVLGANALHNYMESAIPQVAPDRMAPYLRQSAEEETGLNRKKLAAAYQSLSQAAPQRSFGAQSVFENHDSMFPAYIFPPMELAQEELFSTDTLSTSETNFKFIQSAADFFAPETQIDKTASKAEDCIQMFMCPGCPVVAIFQRLDLSDVRVFSSLGCRAVYEQYAVSKMSYSAYMGLTSQKLNIGTLFIGTSDEIRPADKKDSENGKLIVLNNNDSKFPFYSPSSPVKIKKTENLVFPYSCGTIKKYGSVKVNPKKCTCGVGGVHPCAEASHCPALYHDGDSMNIMHDICTGCATCASACPQKAIS